MPCSPWEELANTLRRKAEELVKHYANLSIPPAAFISILCPGGFFESLGESANI